MATQALDRRTREQEPRFSRDEAVRLRPTPRVEPSSVVLRAGVLGLMGALVFFMWIGSPIAWLYLASQLTTSLAPHLGLYLLVLVGVAATAGVTLKAIALLETLHCRLAARDVRKGAPHAAFLRASCEAEPGDDRLPLDSIAVAAVALALAALTAWFFLAAGPSVPVFR